MAASIRGEVSADTYQRWFKGIELTALDEQVLTLCVPNKIYQFWIEDNYSNLLQSAVLLALGASRKLRFICPGGAAPAVDGAKAAAVAEGAGVPGPIARDGATPSVPVAKPEEQS